MAESEIVALANAVVATIAGAELAYAPDFGRLPEGVTKIFVAPAEETVAVLDRGRNQVARKIAVLWARKITNDAEIDPVLIARETIRDTLFRKRLADQLCVAAELAPFYDSTLLREQKILAAPLTLTFQSFAAAVAGS